MDLSFPIREHLSEETSAALLEALTLINKNLFVDGLAALEAILGETLTSEVSLYIRHKINSALFASGEYLQAYEKSQALIKEIKESMGGEDTTDNQRYALLKEQAFTAKCLNKIKDHTKAEEVCDDIIAFIKEKGDDDVQSY